jgi:hypothetical protein
MVEKWCGDCAFAREHITDPESPCYTCDRHRSNFKVANNGIDKRIDTKKLQELFLEVIRTAKEVKQEAISQDPFSDEIGMNIMDALDMAIEDAEQFLSETSLDNNIQSALNWVK